MKGKLENGTKDFLNLSFLIGGQSGKLRCGVQKVQDIMLAEVQRRCRKVQGGAGAVQGGAGVLSDQIVTPL